MSQSIPLARKRINTTAPARVSHFFLFAPLSMEVFMNLT
jgi:hypothetical protein